MLNESKLLRFFDTGIGTSNFFFFFFIADNYSHNIVYYGDLIA